MEKMYEKSELMKLSYQRKQLFIIINQLLVIGFLCYEFLQNYYIGISSILPLTIISLMFFDSAYIQFINIKEKKILYQFSNLLLLSSWNFLCALDGRKIFYMLTIFFSILTLYQVVEFLFIFFFQGSTYTYKKQVDFILKTICLLTVITKLFNNRLFAIMYLLQWILNFSCCIFIFFIHRKRVTFILKNEKKHLLYSLVGIFVPFIIYVIMFAKNPKYLSNLGFYLAIILPLFSIHSIALKNRKEIKQYFILSSKNRLFILICLFAFSALFTVLFQFNVISYFIVIHCLVWFILLYFLLIYGVIKQDVLNRNIQESSIIQNSFYTHTLLQITKEEEIKKDFSNYLHDEVLQDLLSIKNMMKKSDNLEIQEIIINTLNNLNISIRKQMQEYHPTILTTLTLKENINSLLKMIKQKYDIKNIDISFICDDKLFLVKPYNWVIYRILKELVTNAFKHSKCSQIKVLLEQENGEIELVVEDNGIGLTTMIQKPLNSHKGLSSISEQVFLLSGEITMIKKKPSGLCVTINLPMKGDNSYQYFINR